MIGSVTVSEHADTARYFRELLSRPSRSFIANVDTKIELIESSGNQFPLTINDGELSNSYVCSPYNGIITYPLEEVRHVNSRIARVALRSLIHSLSPVLKAAKIDRVVSINNWLLSTNLFPDWQGDDLEELTSSLVKQHPRRAILFRSLNRVTNGDLCRRFSEAGYLLAPSRQVYLFDGTTGDFLRHSNTQTDLRLLENTRLQVCEHQEISTDDFQRVRELYNLLYLDKYSTHNPHFTEKLLALWHSTRVITMTGLRDATGILVGIVGCFERNGVLSAPLVGYDTSVPQKAGLYRQLMAIVLKEASRRKLILNLSSGAASFKRLRGGEPAIEYTAVYCKHLPWVQRNNWKMIAGLLDRIGAKVLTSNQL